MDLKTQMLIEQHASDAMIEKPIGLRIGDKEYKIAPPCFGKMQILSKLFLDLDFDEEQLKANPEKEVMRLSVEKTDKVCELIAVATFNTKEELMDESKIEERAQLIKWEGKPNDFSIVVLAILTQIDYTNFITSITLTKMLRLNKPSTKETEVVE